MLLNTLAQRKAVIVSRGELVEIGGAFRVPDIMQRAGARLVRSRLRQPQPRAGFQSRHRPAHRPADEGATSNYAIEGFTASVDQAELARIAHATACLCRRPRQRHLTDLARWGYAYEPASRSHRQRRRPRLSPATSTRRPQASILVGRADLIGRSENPLKRALRIGQNHPRRPRGRAYASTATPIPPARTPRHAAAHSPAPRRHARPGRAPRTPIAQALAGWPLTVTIEPMLSQIGSGSLPVDRLPSAGLVIRPVGRSRRLGDKLKAALRDLPVPVIGRIADKTCLDLRCLPPADEALTSHVLAEFAPC